MTGKSKEKRLNVLRAREEFERRCLRAVRAMTARGEPVDVRRAVDIALFQPSFFYVSAETAYARMLVMVGAGGRRHGEASRSHKRTPSTGALWQEMAAKVRHRLDTGACRTLTRALGDTLNYDRASRLYMPYSKAVEICRRVIAGEHNRRMAAKYSPR